MPGKTPKATAEHVQSPSATQEKLFNRSERGNRLAKAVGAERLDVVAAIKRRNVWNRTPAQASSGLRQSGELALLKPILEV